MLVKRRYCSLKEEHQEGMCRWRLSIKEEKASFESVCLGVQNLSEKECSNKYLHIITERR